MDHDFRGSIGIMVQQDSPYTLKKCKGFYLCFLSYFDALHMFWIPYLYRYEKIGYYYCTVYYSISMVATIIYIILPEVYCNVLYQSTVPVFE